LPPGTPAADLKPLVRFFALPKQATPGFAPTFPKNPWQDVFSSGTKISAGLSLAHRIAVDNGTRKPVVILVSDLDDDPDDIARLATIMLAYARDHIPLRIVSLNPTPEAVAYFRHILPPQTPIVQAGTLAPGPEPRNHTPFPWTLVALAAVAALGLAVNELWGPRLEWERA
jgi:hypothetical protein